MTRCILALPLVWLACKEPPPLVCRDVPLEQCDATEGCRAREAFPMFTDEPTGRTCWEGEPVIPACVPDFEDARCTPALTAGSAPGSTDCLLFEDVCLPEDWAVCEPPPADRFCPECGGVPLPPHRPADVVLGGRVAFGRSLAVGDVTGDGQTDLLVGSDEGAVVIVGPVAEDSTRLRLTSLDAPTETENAVAVGDWNDDGQADLAVGGPSSKRPGATDRRGAVWVFFGPLDADTTLEDADLVYVGEQVGDELGAGVHAADVDGDGVDDLLAWARRADGDEPEGGRIVLLLGPLAAAEDPVSAADADATMLGADGMGSTLFVADVTGDEAVEVVAETRPGRVVAFGPPWSGEKALVDASTWETGASGDVTVDIAQLAWGDVTGDGTPDLVWTVVEADDLGEAYGAVRVAEGPLPAPGGLAANHVLDGRCPDDRAGAALGLGDADGDGTLDLAVGFDVPGGGFVPGVLRPGPVDAGGVLTEGAERLGAGGWKDVLLADVTGDGRVDVVTGDPDHTTVRVFLGE